MNKVMKIIKRKLCRNWEQYARYISQLGVQMGEECSICKTVSFGSEPYLIKLGKRVKISSDVRFVTHDGGMHVIRKDEFADLDLYGPIIIGDNVFIGMKAIIMPGVNIGDNCIIGAGSIVTKDMPSNSIIAGVPAKVISTLDEYRMKNIPRADKTHGMSEKEKERFLKEKYNIK